MTTTKTDLCRSRGPRIGTDGVPQCGQPLGHYGDHIPDREDGWERSVRWTNLRHPDEREEALAERIYNETNGVAKLLPFSALPLPAQRGYINLVRAIATELAIQS